MLSLALSSVTEAGRLEESNMTLMCQTQRPRLAQRLSILHQDQHFWGSTEPHGPDSPQHQSSSFPRSQACFHQTSGVGPRQRSLCFTLDMIRRRQCEIYSGQDVKPWCHKRVKWWDVAHALHHVSRYLVMNCMSSFCSVYGLTLAKF